MSQSRTGSVFEAVTNVIVGCGINFAANWLVLPILGLRGLTIRSNLMITAIFTVISLVRSYLLRRFFNNLRTFCGVQTVFAPRLKWKRGGV